MEEEKWESPLPHKYARWLHALIAHAGRNEIGGRMLDGFYMGAALLYTRGLGMTGKPITFM